MSHWIKSQKPQEFASLDALQIVLMSGIQKIKKEENLKPAKKFFKKYVTRFKKRFSPHEGNKNLCLFFYAKIQIIVMIRTMFFKSEYLIALHHFSILLLLMPSC